MDAIEQIALNPQAGAPREVRHPRLAGLRMRVVPEFRSYLIFYVAPDDSVQIVRVFHGAQDIKGIVEDDE